MTEQAQILESLLEHPGWRLYQAHVDAEWGPRGARYLEQLERALNQPEDTIAAGQARQILSARKVVDSLMQWPAEELARLKRAERGVEAGVGRGGYR